MGLVQESGVEPATDVVNGGAGKRLKWLSVPYPHGFNCKTNNKGLHFSLNLKEECGQL